MRKLVGLAAIILLLAGCAAMPDSDDVFERSEVPGIPFAESRYGTRGYFPTAPSWADGDRELLCTVVDESGAQLTGPLGGVGE